MKKTFTVSVSSHPSHACQPILIVLHDGEEFVAMTADGAVALSRCLDAMASLVDTLRREERDRT